MQQGWNLTGDAYRHDADGYFWYEARTDDMIVSSGYNVSGVEVKRADGARVGRRVRGRRHPGRGARPDYQGVRRAGGRHRRIGCARARVAGDCEVGAGAASIHARGRVRGGAAADADGQAATASVASWCVSINYARLAQPAACARTNPRVGRGPAGMRTPSVPDGARGLRLRTGGLGSADPAFTAGDFAAEVRQALTNVVAALDAAGARPDQIARLTWYITDRDEYLNARAEIGRAYRGS